MIKLFVVFVVGRVPRYPEELEPDPREVRAHEDGLDRTRTQRSGLNTHLGQSKQMESVYIFIWRESKREYLQIFLSRFF